MKQRNKLEIALQELEFSKNSDDRKAHAWLMTILTSINGIPKANSYRITNWFNIAKSSKQILTLWWHKDNYGLKNTLKQPGTWKVIFLALPQTEDFHPDIMPQILNSLLQPQILEEQRSFMESQAGRTVSTYELQQLLNGNSSSYDDEFNTQIKRKCALIKEHVTQKTIGLFEYALFIAKDLDTAKEYHLDALCNKIAALNSSVLGTYPATSSKELFQQHRCDLLYSKLLKNGHTKLDITEIMLATHELLEQEFEAAETLSRTWAKRYKQTAPEQELLQSKLLKMFATSILLQDHSKDPKSTIIMAAENLIGEKIPTNDNENLLLNTITQKQHQTIKQDYTKNELEDSIPDENGFYDATDLTQQEQTIEDIANRSSGIQKFVNELLQDGFLNSSFEEIPEPNNKTRKNITGIAVATVKSLSKNGLSNFGLDFMADGLWPTSQEGSIQRHKKYHGDPEYKSILSELESDIAKLLPFLKEPSLQNKIINLANSILENRPDKMYFIYESIIALLTLNPDQEASQSQELILTASLSSGETPKHISNLILAIIHERIALRANNDLFKITADNGKALLQMLEPVLTIILKESMINQKTRAPLLKLLKEIHNETDTANKMLTLLKPPHNMTRLEVTSFLALSTQKQAEYKASNKTKAVLKEQVAFHATSSAKRNTAIIEFLDLDVLRTKIASKLAEDDTTKDITSLIINIIKDRFPNSESKFDQATLDYLQQSLPELLKAAFNNPRIQSKITAALYDSQLKKKASNLSLFTTVANILFEPEIKEILVKRPNELLHIIQKFLGTTISEKNLQDIASALPNEPKEQISKQDLLEIIGKIPFTTILNVHKKASFHNDGSLFLKLTYPIHLIILILCLIIIAPALTTAKYIVPLSNKSATDAKDLKPGSMALSKDTIQNTPTTNNIAKFQIDNHKSTK